jgi:hypothetical protein
LYDNIIIYIYTYTYIYIHNIYIYTISITKYKSRFSPDNSTRPLVFAGAARRAAAKVASTALTNGSRQVRQVMAIGPIGRGRTGKLEPGRPQKADAKSSRPPLENGLKLA